MPKPMNNQNKTRVILTRFAEHPMNNKRWLVGQNAVKRVSMTKKDRLKKMEIESSQQSTSEVEKAKKEEVDEQMKKTEREEARRRWLQEQRFKYPVAPDGYIPNSIVRRNLQPYVPHPPEKQTDNNTKPHQPSLLERRMSRLERMTSAGMLGSPESRLTYSAASAALRQTSVSSAFGAVDRDRSSSKKKSDRADVVNDVITQMRQTSPQLTSFLELEDIAEMKPRFEESTTSMTSEDGEESARERGRGRGGELVDEEGQRGIEEATAQEDYRKDLVAVSAEEDETMLRGIEKDVDSTDPLLSRSLPPDERHSSQHHEDSSSTAFSSSVAKKPAKNNDKDQILASLQPNKENEDVASTGPIENSPEKDEEDANDAEEDGATFSVSAALTAADDAHGDTEGEAAAAAAAAAVAEKRDVAERTEAEEADDSSRPLNLEIPRIIEPDDKSSNDEDTREAEQLKRFEESEAVEVELTDKDGVVAEHDGYGVESNDVTGSPSLAAPSGTGNLKRNEPSSDAGFEEDAVGQRDESDGFNSKGELITVLEHISLPYVGHMDSAADEEMQMQNETKDEEEKAVDLSGDLPLNRITEDEPEVDEDEFENEMTKAGRRATGAGWSDGGDPASCSFALRPPRIHDDDLDLTSFNSLRVATNNSLPTFSDMDESQNRGNGVESANFLNSSMARYLNELSYGTNSDKYGRGKEEKKATEEEEEQLQEEDENDRCCSSSSNGRLIRRYNREAMEDGSIPSPPLGWHLSWYDRYYRDEPASNNGSSKADRRDACDSEAGAGFLPQLLSRKEKKSRRHHGCEYSMLVQRRMHEHISITRYLRTKRLTEALCDLGRPINYNIIKFQFSA